MADTLTPNLKLTNQQEGGNNNSWGSIADANFEEIDDKLGDLTQITTVGGTTTLTDSQEIVGIVEVGGVLASNATIEFSGRGGFWIVRNETTGSYTATFKVTGQTGVVVVQGDVRVLYCNGVDIVYGQQVAAGSAIPVGAVIDYSAGASGLLPTDSTGWLFCYGQNVSRTTYAALFALLATFYGAGDSVTTFTLPDYRGRVLAGKDDMGGSSANRLTNQTGGLNGDTLGATGGSETATLTRANLTNDTVTTGGHSVSHTHTANDASSKSSNAGTDNGVITQVWRFSSSSSTGGASADHTHSFALNGGVSQTAFNIVQPTAITTKLIYTGVA